MMHQRCLLISGIREHSLRLHSTTESNNHNDYRKRPPKGAVIEVFGSVMKVQRMSW